MQLHVRGVHRAFHGVYRRGHDGHCGAHHDDRHGDHRVRGVRHPG